MIFGENRLFSLFHRSLGCKGRPAAPLMGRRQVALQERDFRAGLVNMVKAKESQTLEESKQDVDVVTRR